MAYAQGIYNVKNQQKYVGKGNPRYRSGWEMTFMMFCDNNDHVLKWASESIQIPYFNPIKGRNTIYVPDFFLMYRNKRNEVVAEVIEIKPKKETLIESKKVSARNRAVVAINHSKWQAANAWCRQNGLKFRVLTETELFFNGRPK